MNNKNQQEHKQESKVSKFNFDLIEDRYYLFALLNAFANRMQVVGDALFDEVTWKQWFAMLGVSVFSSAPSISEVAELVGTSHQNMKQLLLRLQAAGLIELSKDNEDRRRTLIYLTEEAKTFEAKYRDGSESFMASLFEGILPSDLATARKVISRLDDNLRTIEVASNHEGA